MNGCRLKSQRFLLLLWPLNGSEVNGLVETDEIEEVDLLDFLL